MPEEPNKQTSKLPHTSDSVLQELTDIERKLTDLDPGLQEPCMVFGEATREKIADLLSRNPKETLACASGEARGCINVLMGRYNRKTDEDMYVALWTGDYCKISRINRPDTVLRNPCLSLLWLVQPDLLGQLISSDGMNESGFLARTLIFEVSPAFQTKTMMDLPIVPPTQLDWRALVTWLADASYRQTQPFVFHCQPTTVSLMTCFNSCLIERMKPGGDLADVYSFAARWVEQAWRIMLVLHVAKLNIEQPHHVSAETAHQAIQLMDWFATQQLLLLTSTRENKHDERFEALLEVLRRKPGQCCSLRDMRRRHGFLEAEVLAISQAHPGIVAVKELKAQGPGRPSLNVALVQVEGEATT